MDCPYLDHSESRSFDTHDPSVKNDDRAFCSGPKERPINSDVHYHILWSNSTVDWKPFTTREEAEQFAESINPLKEVYTAVERGADCERCRAFKASR